MCLSHMDFVAGRQGELQISIWRLHPIQCHDLKLLFLFPIASPTVRIGFNKKKLTSFKQSNARNVSKDVLISGDPNYL